MSEAIDARLDDVITELLGIFAEAATANDIVLKARFDRAMADFVTLLNEAAIAFWADAPQR
jgi:hypothetical protein